MPKPNFVISGYQKNELFKQLCIQIGFPIRTKSDCRKVSELIDQAGLASISESTIYRLFLLKSNNNQPYLHTLNSLAQFCSYKDWHEFEHIQQETENFVFGFGKISREGAKFKSLISICIQTNELKPLLQYTEQFEQGTKIQHKEKFAEEVFQAVLTNKNNALFFKKFSHFSVIREHFFEILADPTFSIPGYEDGIKYYLKNLKHEASNKDLQDVVFGNCLLFRHYYLTEQVEKANATGTFLFDELRLTTKQLEKIHVFPIARYYACKFMYLDMHQEIKQTHLFFDEVIYDLHKKIPLLSIEEQRILFYSLGEAMVLNSILIAQQHQLKELFTHLFDFLPSRLASQPLEKIVPYFNKNSSIYQFNNEV